MQGVIATLKLYSTVTIAICYYIKQQAIFIDFGHIFKPGTHAWVLEIAFDCNVGMRVCVRPRGHKLHSRDIEPVQPAEQVRCI